MHDQKLCYGRILEGLGKIFFVCFSGLGLVHKFILPMMINNYIVQNKPSLASIGFVLLACLCSCQL
jgi:hypothetical protein